MNTTRATSKELRV
nr:unnamed protein product [Callosobruchus analis]